MLRGILAACLVQGGLIAGAGLARRDTPDVGPVFQMRFEVAPPAPAPPAAAAPAPPSPLPAQPPPQQQQAEAVVADSDPLPTPVPPDTEPALNLALPAPPEPNHAPAIRPRAEPVRAAPRHRVARQRPSPEPPTRTALAQPAQAPSSAAPQTAAPAAAPAAAAQAEASLEGRILSAVQAALRIPPAARLMGLSGRTHVLIRYRDGVVSGARIERSAGSPLLDDAALAAVRDAAYPKPPPELAGRALRLALWVRISVS